MKTTHKFLIAVILVSIIGSTSAVSHANVVKNTVEDNLALSDKNDYLLGKRTALTKLFQVKSLINRLKMSHLQSRQYQWHAFS